MQNRIRTTVSYITYILCIVVVGNPALQSGNCSAAKNNDKVAITLDEGISFGMKNGYLMKLYRQSLEYSMKNVEATRAGLKSYLDLTTNLPYFSTEVEGIKDIYGITCP